MTSTTTTYAAVMLTPILATWAAMWLLRIGPADPWREGGTGLAVLDTRDAFDSARWRHARARLLTRLTGRGDALELAVLPPASGARGRRSIGERMVRLDRIVGSVDAGQHLFDRRFDPTDNRAWSRFSSVFAARSSGADLPPVLLYRGPGGYYVLDGHHRVAVARAMGDDEIAAEVTVLCD
jgi:hypothetical protein